MTSYNLSGFSNVTIKKASQTLAPFPWVHFENHDIRGDTSPLQFILWFWPSKWYNDTRQNGPCPNLPFPFPQSLDFHRRGPGLQNRRPMRPMAIRWLHVSRRSAGRRVVILPLGSTNDLQGVVDGEVWHRVSWLWTWFTTEETKIK